MYNSFKIFFFEQKNDSCVQGPVEDGNRQIMRKAAIGVQIQNQCLVRAVCRHADLVPGATKCIKNRVVPNKTDKKTES